MLVIRSTETGLVRSLQPRMERFSSIRWSPDTRSLAVVGQDFKGRQGIFQVDAQSGEVILVSEGSVSPPVWAVDGSALYYLRYSDQPTVRLISKDLKSGSETEIFSRDRQLSLWGISPDGRYIAIRSDNGNRSAKETTTSFLLVPVAGGEARELIRKPGLGGINFSPDGRYVGTKMTDPVTKSNAILLIPVEGGEPRELMRVPVEKNLMVFMWAPDSRSVFVRPDHASSEVWRVPVDGGEGKRAAFRADRIAGGFQVSPDGRHVAYLTTTADAPVRRGNEQRKTELWTLQGYLPAAVTKQ